MSALIDAIAELVTRRRGAVLGAILVVTLVAGAFIPTLVADPRPQQLTTFVDGFRLHDHKKALDFVDKLFHRPHPMRHVLAWGVRQQFGRSGIDDLLRSITPSDLLRPEELSGLEMPVFMLWGEADRVLWPEHRRFFEEHLPAHAEIHRIEEYGHVPHMSHPDCLAARLLEFARQVGQKQ